MTGAHGTITVAVPFSLRRHGRRKQVITPDGHPSLAPPRDRVDKQNGLLNSESRWCLCLRRIRALTWAS
jgi:hypothetical protein